MAKAWLGLGLLLCAVPGAALAAEDGDPIECAYRNFDLSEIRLVFSPDQPGNEAQAGATTRARGAVAACTALHAWTQSQVEAAVHYAWGRFNYEAAVEQQRRHKLDPDLLDKLVAPLTEEAAARVRGGDLTPLGPAIQAWFRTAPFSKEMTAAEAEAFGEVLGAGLGGLLLLRDAKVRFERG